MKPRKQFPEQPLRALAVIAAAYGGTFLLAAWAGGSWARWIVSLPLVAALQNHLMLLHHEGAHGLLHPRRSVNDLLANVFCGFPFLELMAPYRRFHFAHHRHVADPGRDPEIPFYREQGFEFRPLPPRAWLKLGFLDLCGYHWGQFFFSFARSLPGSGRLLSRLDSAALALFLLALAGLLAAGLAGGILWFWVVPQVTVAFFLAKQRGYREHQVREGGLEGRTRNLPASLLARVFVFPLNAHLHLAHHRHPGVPWFRLPACAEK